MWTRGQLDWGHVEAYAQSDARQHHARWVHSSIQQFRRGSRCRVAIELERPFDSNLNVIDHAC